MQTNYFYNAIQKFAKKLKSEIYAFSSVEEVYSSLLEIFLLRTIEDTDMIEHWLKSKSGNFSLLCEEFYQNMNEHQSELLRKVETFLTSNIINEENQYPLIQRVFRKFLTLRKNEWVFEDEYLDSEFERLVLFLQVSVEFNGSLQSMIENWLNLLLFFVEVDDTHSFTNLYSKATKISCTTSSSALEKAYVIYYHLQTVRRTTSKEVKVELLSQKSLQKLNALYREEDVEHQLELLCKIITKHRKTSTFSYDLMAWLYVEQARFYLSYNDSTYILMGIKVYEKIEALYCSWKAQKMFCKMGQIQGYHLLCQLEKDNEKYHQKYNQIAQELMKLNTEEFEVFSCNFY